MKSPHLSETKQDFPKLLLSGIDSLYVGYFLDDLGIDWEELAYQKELLKQDHTRDFAKITLGGQEWALLPSGQHPYAYILKNQHFTVKLAERNQPNCYVQFRSKGLWRQRLSDLRREMEDWFVALGARATRSEKVSRADFAFDFHLDSIDFTAECFRSRATKDGSWREHRQEQSFQFGRGDVVVRVYDKVAEVEQESGKAWLYELWGQSQNVWRVEFQVRGSRLETGGIRTLDDLIDHQGDLVRELARNHTTLRKPNGDSNSSRWPFHPLWRSLINAIDQMPQLGLVEAIKDPNGLSYSLERQIVSLYGDLKGIASTISLCRKWDRPISLEELLKLAPDLLRRHHHAELWRADVEKRMAARRLGHE